MLIEGESHIELGREFQALAAVRGKLRSAMARVDLVTGTTKVEVSVDGIQFNVLYTSSRK